MSKRFQPHVEKLREYLFQPSERNEDLALSYFRELYGESFKRQNDAANADGYVAGHFVLELKGDTNDWYSALFQGLAYKNRGFAYSGASRPRFRFDRGQRSGMIAATLPG